MRTGQFDILKDTLRPESNSFGIHAAHDSTSRSFLLYPTNVYVENSSFNRTQLAKKVRSLDANLPIITRLKQKIGQYAIGKGVLLIPVSDDLEWNEQAKKYLENWAGNKHLYSIDGQRDMYQDQLLAAEGLVSDGEYFAVKIKNPYNGKPMTQALDIFEVASPSFAKGADRYVDGVRLDRFGKALSYAVQEASTNLNVYETKIRDIPASSMIHVFKPKRAKMFRGMSWFCSAINSGVDVLDLKQLIISTAKLHSALGLVVTGKDVTTTGASGLISKAFTNGTTGTTQATAVENVFGGGITQYLKEGEKVEMLSSDRPSENLLNFINYIYADIAIALGIPLETVYSLAPLTGTATRAVLEDAQNLFDMVQDMVIWQHSIPLYRWVLSWAMKHGELPLCKDFEWWDKISIRPTTPRTTVDFGRNATATVSLVKNGLLSYSRYYSERGQEAKEEIGEQIEMIQWIKDECESKGVKPEWVMEGLLKSIPDEAEETPTK